MTVPKIILNLVFFMPPSHLEKELTVAAAPIGEAKADENLQISLH